VKLLIAIPALNEEAAIEDIIERSLAAREFIVSNSPVTDIAITVVSDGSTDATEEKAKKYLDRIHVIVFPKNRGYGAAIKEAWRQSDADLLGFIDADGTCDPKFFASLCAKLEKENADVVLGCRLNEESRMPLIRRVGNVLFATILTAFSSKRVRDTASGMRVVRKSSLDRLYPLPDGLHFTPAMSARAILSPAITIVEVNMPYHERTGESKLRVGKDGLRFLKVIVEAAFLYHPSRPLGIGAIALMAAAAALMAPPAIYYLQHQVLEEWMIYRFIVSQIFAIAACLCLCASYLTGRIVDLTLADEAFESRYSRTVRFFQSRAFWLVPALLSFAGTVLVFRGFLQLITTGHVTEHWSRFVVMSFCFSAATILAITRAVDYILQLLRERIQYVTELKSGDG
jgi:glycosyltransferase involved in cell wall biosynthesis